MVTIEPKLSIWNEPYGTIDQFARALADAVGGFTYDEAYAKVLSAIWLGEFERDGKVSTYLPGATAPGSRQAADGSFVDFYRDDKKPRPSDEPFTREDLRNALYGNDVRAKSQKDMSAYEELAVKRPGEFDVNFRSAYLDPLVIETEAVNTWLSDQGPKQLRSDVIYRTGTPGRPTSIQLILEQAKTMASLGTVPALKTQFAEELRAWLRNNHKGAPLPTAKTITNNSAVSSVWKSRDPK